MTMIFRHGFFHGDPHPANIMLLDDGRIGLVDFGLAGKLTDEDMTRLTRLFVDAATENVEALPRRLSELGLRYPKEREQELRDAIEELYYRYYGASVSSIDPIEVIREGLDLIYSLNLRLPTRFVILDKAIATLGAVGVELYPDFNVFEVAKPYARKLMVERFSPKRMTLRMQSEVRELASVARELPYQMRDIVEQTRQGRLEVNIRNPGIDELTLHIDHAINRIAIALIVSGGLVGSSILGVVNARGPQLIGVNLIAFLGFVISGVFGVWLIWGIVRSGRL
jgi:ubiquinone biosynthesis protein